MSAIYWKQAMQQCYWAPEVLWAAADYGSDATDATAMSSSVSKDKLCTVVLHRRSPH